MCRTTNDFGTPLPKKQIKIYVDFYALFLWTRKDVQLGLNAFVHGQSLTTGEVIEPG